MSDAPAWTIALLGLGIFGMLLGPAIVGWLVPETAVWTEEDAVALSHAGADLHAAMHAHSDEASHNHAEHAEHTHASTPLAKAQAAYDAQQQKLDTSRSRRGWLKFGARGLGVVLALAGLAGIVLRRKNA